MQDQRRYVAELVALNGGEIVGKIRLQKIAYLLEAAGLGIDLDYEVLGQSNGMLMVSCSGTAVVA